MLRVKNENKTSKKEANINYKGLDLLNSPIKDILNKLAEDTFSSDNRKDEEKSLKKEGVSYDDGYKAILDISSSLKKLRDGLFYLNDMKDHPNNYRKRDSDDLALKDGRTQYDLQSDTVDAIDTIRRAIEVAAERYTTLEDYFIEIEGD